MICNRILTTFVDSTNGDSADTFKKVSEEQRRPIQRNPYGPNPADFLSNVNNFQLIESTLREGEQFANAFFTTEKKIEIAKLLDDFGVDYIELTSPVASEQSRLDCEAICKLGLKAKILTHIRCHMDDARVAVETGVDGVDVVIGTSQFLRQYSHGKDMNYIAQSAVEVIEFVKSKGIEIRFSSEDSFRSDIVDLLNIYKTVDKIGVNRVGIADTVGCANPRQVYELVKTLKSVVHCDIECHFHNDTGCAISNAYAALQAGVDYVDTCILGIGERNGITSLSGLMARCMVADRDYILSKYDVTKLKKLEELIAESVGVTIPFNNPVTGFSSFTHKAGIHTKAILTNPSTYEILKPEDFGLKRTINFANKLTGWNVIKSRIQDIGLDLPDSDCKAITAIVKVEGDQKQLTVEDVDKIIHDYVHQHNGGVSKKSKKD